MSKNIYLGVDIGATKTLFLVVRFSGKSFKILESSRCETPHNVKQILALVEANYRNYAVKYKIGGIGIGFAGPVDHEKGEALKGPNLGTGKINFKKHLEGKLKISVALDNDAKCFLFAESAFGVAAGRKNIVGLTLGTGIGGAIMIEGKIYRGADNFAGEIGHADIEKNREFEKIASGSGLVNIYQKIAGKNLDSFQIIELAEKKNKSALKTVETVAENLGTGMANILEIFNPEIIVLGGGISEVNLIVDKAREYAKKKVFLPSLSKTPIIVSKLGQTSVALGAAWMAKEAK